MLKAAIEKIEALARPEIVKDEMDYSYVITNDGVAHEITHKNENYQLLDLNSLDALVQMVRQESHFGKMYIEVTDHKTVECFGAPDDNYVRPEYYRAYATDVPGWDPEVKLPFEKAAIALQTRFQPGGDLDYTIQLLSQLTCGAKVTYNDIGVATNIVTQKGVSLQQNTVIRPVVSLRPYRTFQEVEQPMGKFLIRIDERGISFIEADGGMWKLTARNTVKAYLENELRPLIDSGNVVVML